MNPGRGKISQYTPARVTVVVLTYVPNDIGYFSNRFDVSRVCIESILMNTTVPYDLMVFDNGSGSEVVDYLRTLRDSGKIDFLILSNQNVGKIGALQIIFRAAPGSVIAYSDDDIFFLPRWLESQLEVLDTYPNVGAVTGMYIKPHMKEGVQATMKFAARKDVKSEMGNLIDEALEEHYIKQTGRTLDRYREEIKGLQDVYLKYRGVETFASSGHYQFTAFKDSILRALPQGWSGNLMGKMRDLDVAIDDLGMLRLCTQPPTIRLLGNLIDQDVARDIQKYGIEAEGVEKPKEMPDWERNICRSSLVKKIAYFFYERLFKIINA